MNQIACPSCGSENPPGFRFCGACGAAMERACPACGAANPPGFRFCGSCGATLQIAATSAADDVEERKVVTALFADLTASTEMASRLDPEDLRKVLGPFFDAMVEEIGRFGGTVEKFIGDAVVAVFGVPAAHEDDPERAVRAALAMHRRLGELNEELATAAGGDLAMRIGVNTGEVFAHGGGTDEGLVTGEAVNIAARFQTFAKPGTVVVGERTYRDTRHAFAFRSLDRVNVKGIDRPLSAWEVEGDAPTSAGPSAATRAPFIGRESEMELLRLLFARTVREGKPNLVTIVGPPGIGKSRLSHELSVAVTGTGKGARVLRGRCLPYGDGLTYWPMAEILKTDAGILDNDPPEAILEKARVRLGPRFAGDDDGLGLTSILLSSIGVSVPSDPLAGAEPAAAQRMIARAWQRFLESTASEVPVVALIEDIHWADPRLLDLIETVVARASGAAFVLCMARPDLFERRVNWGGGLTNATTVSLSPLSAGEGAVLIEHLLGGDAPPEVVGPILHRSEGNPFFAGELLRMMTEDGTLDRRDGRWALVKELPSVLPDTVQGVIASRIDLLAPGEKRAIQDASVIGRVFWQGAVERLGTRDAIVAIEGLIGKGLVWERESSSIKGERELIFNHILTRDVAYASIPRTRRAEAHAAIGTWVEDVTSGRDEEFAEILAYHFDAAGDLASTARYAMLAGHRHRRVFAAEEAIGWYDRALGAAKTTGEAASADLIGEVAVSRGEVNEQIGRYVDARADYGRALECARAAGDGRLEARALAAIAHVNWMTDRYDEGQTILPEALERARAVGAADLEARLLYTAGTIAFGRGSFDEALGFHERALDVATTSGDLEGEALARHGLCETRFFLGPFEEGLADGLRADSILRSLGQRPMVHHNEYMLGWLHWFLGRPVEARTVTDGSVAGCREVGNRRDEVMALNARIEMRLSAGDVGGALDDARDAVAVATEIGVPRARMIAGVCRADALAELWAFEGMESDVRIAMELSETIGGKFQRAAILSLAGWLALVAGIPDRAADRFGRAWNEAASLLDRLWAGRTEILAWEWAGDPRGLDAVGRRFSQLETEVPLWSAWGVYAPSLAALLRKEWQTAAELGERARAAALRGGERRVLWRADRVAWLALRELGRGKEAETPRLRALEIVRAEARSISDEALRSSFLSRPDVADLLGGQ